MAICFFHVRDGHNDIIATAADLCTESERRGVGLGDLRFRKKLLHNTNAAFEIEGKSIRCFRYVKLQREDYWDFDQPRPIEVEREISEVDTSETAVNARLEALGRSQKKHKHPMQEEARLLEEERNNMGRTKTVTAGSQVNTAQDNRARAAELKRQAKRLMQQIDDLEGGAGAGPEVRVDPHNVITTRGRRTPSGHTVSFGSEPRTAGRVVSNPGATGATSRSGARNGREAGESEDDRRGQSSRGTRGNGGRHHGDDNGRDRDQGEDNQGGRGNLSGFGTWRRNQDGDGSGDSPSSSSEEDRNRRRKKSKKKSKSKRKRHSSSSSSSDSLDSDWYCPESGCGKRCTSKSQKDLHKRTCQFYAEYKEGQRLDEHRDLSKFFVTYRETKYGAYVDDNINRLHQSRYKPVPSDWAQLHAQAPVEAKPVRWNYPLEKLGVTVMNKRLIVKLHRMDFQDMSVHFFTSANLLKSSIKYSSGTKNRDPEEVWLVRMLTFVMIRFGLQVVSKESDIKELLKGLNNYRIIMRCIFPARFDADIFYSAMMARYVSSSHSYI